LETLRFVKNIPPPLEVLQEDKPPRNVQLRDMPLAVDILCLQNVPKSPTVATHLCKAMKGQPDITGYPGWLECSGNKKNNKIDF